MFWGVDLGGLNLICVIPLFSDSPRREEVD